MKGRRLAEIAVATWRLKSFKWHFCLHPTRWAHFKQGQTQHIINTSQMLLSSFSKQELTERHWRPTISSALRTLQWERKTDPGFPGVPRDKHHTGTVLKEVKAQWGRGISCRVVWEVPSTSFFQNPGEEHFSESVLCLTNRNTRQGRQTLI